MFGFQELTLIFKELSKRLNRFVFSFKSKQDKVSFPPKSIPQMILNWPLYLSKRLHK